MSKGLRMSAAEFEEHRARIGKMRPPIDQALNLTARQKLAEIEQQTEKKGSKYNNEKVQTDEGTFDSKAEYRYWCQLQIRIKAREVRNLQRQVPFILAPAVEIKGRKKPPLRYIADFVFEELSDGYWRRVIADVKGKETKEYSIKRHLMKSVLGVDIEEIRS